MATYKGIKGVKVQSRASDPTASEATGTVWYNTATTALKYAIEGAGTWAAGGTMGTARYGLMAEGNAGVSSSSAQVAGGYTGPPPTGRNYTEQYNGTAWTEVANMNTTRFYMTGCGTITAALIMGGDVPGGARSKATEKWDGTSWSTTGDLNSLIQNAGAFGITTAAVKVGGTSGGAETETYNGSTWSVANNLTTARNSLGTAGITTAGLAFGGSPPGTVTETWDGTSWAETQDLNTARGGGGSGGTQTAAMMATGAVVPTEANTVNVEIWDGSSWSETSNVATGRYRVGCCRNAGAGITTNSIVFGGNTPTPVTGITEEFADPAYTIKTVTVS